MKTCDVTLGERTCNIVKGRNKKNKNLEIYVVLLIDEPLHPELL